MNFPQGCGLFRVPVSRCVIAGDPGFAVFEARDRLAAHLRRWRNWLTRFAIAFHVGKSPRLRSRPPSDPYQMAEHLDHDCRQLLRSTQFLFTQVLDDVVLFAVEPAEERHDQKLQRHHTEESTPNSSAQFLDITPSV